MNLQIEADLSKAEPSHVIAEHIVSLLRSIRFGSLEIVVHDGRVVQIDKHEKFRMKSPSQQH